MQKVVKFLEEYIQWIAVGLGVVWVLWMGYQNWANDPVFATVGNKKVSPGDVDQEIQKSAPVDTLDKASRNEGPYPRDVWEYLHPDKQAAGGPTPTKEFKEAMDAMIAAVPERAPSPFPGGAPQSINPTPENQITVAGATLPDVKGVAALETGPNGEVATTGMSVVIRPDPNVPFQPQVAPGQPPQTTIPRPDVDLKKQVQLVNQQNDPNNPNPNPNPNVNQPGQLDANGQPIGPPPIVTLPEQVTWVTVSGTIDMKKLAAAFQKANVPAAASFTSLLRVELIRDEMQPDGSWKPSPSPNGVVPDLTNVFKPDMPSNIPAAGLDQQVAAVYANWAASHVADIVQPPFYEYCRGDMWHTVTMPDPAAALLAQQPQNFDAASVKPGEVNNLPPDQRQKWLEWKKQQDAAKHPVRRAPSTPSGGSRGGTDAAGFFEGPAFDPDSMTQRPQINRAAPAPQRTYVPPTNYAQPGVQPSLLPNQPAALPNGTFNPAQQQADLEIWAHDETTTPGKTYRYKLRVYFKNPLFLTNQMAKNPKDADVFALVCDTDWTKPISAPNVREFFVSNGGTLIGGVPKVGVEFFKWEDGSWKETVHTLQPGDRIGDTPWSIYDLRQASGTGNENQILLVNDNGETSSRFYKTDRSNPDRQRLMKLVQLAAAPPPGAADQTGGAQPGVTPNRPNPVRAAGGAGPGSEH